MHLQTGLFLDIVIAVAAACVGGVAARVLRLPLLLGYLAVGMIIGPHVLGVIRDMGEVSSLAEIGVVLLLFAVGVEISFRDLRKLGGVSILGGIAQVLGTTILGYIVGIGVGWSSTQAFLFGLVISMSSTMVVLKILTDRGELKSLHGRILTGMLLVQDLAFIPMVAILPAFQSQGESFLPALGIGLAKAVLALGLLVVLGAKAIPWLLYRIAGLRSREVFIITLVALSFGLATLTQSIGLSAALGAFLAGAMLSESDFGHRALAEIQPLRDIFAALFFVSLGMLTDPTFLFLNPALVLLVVVTVIAIKLVLTTAIIRAFRYFPQTAILSGLGMVQIGEFSFIIASAAATRGLVDSPFLTLVIVAAAITMALTPMIMAAGTWAISWVSQQTTWLQPYSPGNDVLATSVASEMEGHIIIAGIGRVGSLVADVMADLGLPFVIVDLDPHVVTVCKEKGWHAIHGASYNGAVLHAAGIERAALLVIATGDALAGLPTVAQALRTNPSLDIVARVRSREEGEQLKEMGVTEVIWPEMEAGLEALRHSLLAYGASPRDVEGVVGVLRERLAFGSVIQDKDEEPGDAELLEEEPVPASFPGQGGPEAPMTDRQQSHLPGN